MRIRSFVVLCSAILFATALLAQATAEKSNSSATKPKAKVSTADWKSIHNRAIVIDTHADTTGRFVDENFDPADDAGSGHWDLAKVRAGNLGAEFFSVWVDPEKYKGQYAHRALAMIDSVYETVRKHPDDMVMAFSTKDIRAARTGPRKRLAALIGVEGGHAIENDPRILRDFFRLGVRYMTLTWMNSTEWAQSSGDVKTDPQTGKPNDPGLTDAGRGIVREMNRMGMMVDVSHVSDRSFYHTLTVSRAPVIASHSSSRAITDHARNLTDDMLVALARNGGVAQVNFNCGFVSNEFIQRARKFREDHPQEFARYRELNRQYMATHSDEAKKELDGMEAQLRQSVPRPPFQVLIDHIDHMVKVAGVNHVGIGSDFDGVDCMPEGLDSVADLPKITQALAKLGYSERDINKILGGNLLRVFGEVERVAQQIQHESNADRRKEVTLPPAQKQ